MKNMRPAIVPSILIVQLGNQSERVNQALSAFFPVHQATSVEKAISMLAANSFSLILVEDNLEESSCQQALEELRSFSPEIPVFCISSQKEKTPFPSMNLVDQAGQTLLSQLAGNIAHDITNSISFVVSNLRTLCMYHEDIIAALPQPSESLRSVIEDLYPLVEESIEGVTKIQAIAKELRAFTKKEESAPESVDIHDLLEGAIRYTNPEFHHRISLTRHYAAKNRVLVSPSRMRQCLAHLLLSVTRTQLPSPTRHEVVVETRNDLSGIEVSLISGAGFDRCLIQETWLPFFSGNPPKVENSTLFLAAGQAIARQHAGSLQLGSSWPDSLRLTLRLPNADQASIRPPDSPTS